MKKKEKLRRKLLSFLLTLAMVVGLLPGMGLLAYADGAPPYAGLKNTTTVVTFDGKPWYLIDYDDTTVTLLSKECVGASAFGTNQEYLEYSGSTVETAVNSYYTDSISTDAKTAVNGGMFLLTNDQANTIENANPDVLKCSQATGAQYNYWWLSSRHEVGKSVLCVAGESGGVYGEGANVTLKLGVRPALQLDLSKVTFDSTTKTFSLKPAVTEYPLWVGGVQVTDENRDDLANSHWSYTPATTGDNPTPATLTLNGYSCDGVGYKDAAIYAEGDLVIDVRDDSSVTGPAPSGFGFVWQTYGVMLGTGTLTVRGPGTLTARGGDYSGQETATSCGVLADNIVVEQGASLVAEGGKSTMKSQGAYARNTVSVQGTLAATGGTAPSESVGLGSCETITVAEGGTLTATGGASDDESYGVNTFAGVNVSGSMTATGGASDDSYGVYTYGSVNVGAGARMTAAGGKAAVYGTVKNAIAGTGWTDTEGTTGKAAITVSEAGQTLNSYKKIQFPAVHDHSFTYTSTGDMITATCSKEGCTLPKVGEKHIATLTIVMPTMTTYGGTGSAAATITDENSIKGEAEVKYFNATKSGETYTKTGDALTAAPTNAGNYVAEITLGEDTNEATASVGYTIAPKPVTVSGITAENKTYDGTTDATLDYTYASISGKLEDDNLTVTATGAFEDANVGDKTVNLSDLTLGGTDKDNYVLAATGQQATATAGINPKSISGATVTLDKTQLTYNGSEQTVNVTDVTTTDGMSLTENTDYIVNGNTGIDKNDYTVTVTGLGNFTNIATANWKIVEKAMTVKADNVTVTYDGKEHGIKVEVSDPESGAEVKYGTTEDTYDLDECPTIKDAGTLTIYYKVTAGSNYSVYTGKAVVTVEKHASTAASVTANDREYDGTEKPLVNVTGEATGGEMQYAIGTDATTAPTTGYTTSIPTATDAGTYYVWYKVVGDSTHTDTEPVSITVTIKNKPSTPNTPYTPSTPGAPAAEAYTVPVSNENTVDISVNISEGNAVVQEITQADLDKITDDTSGSGSDGDKKTDDTKISVDVSGAKSEVTSVELSSTSIETLAKTVEANEKVDSVEIKMTNATVELDSAAVSAISEQKEGNTIKLVVENKEQAKLNETQKESLKSFTSVKPFQAYFESGGKEIHDFKGGKATVSIKFSPEAGRDAKYYHVYYVPLSGLIERYVTRYLNGWFSYTTSHFSDYAIVYDATMENETGKEDVTPSPSPDVIPTASPAPSASASPSPAPSASASPSPAPSASTEPSVAPSASASPSPAPSASTEPSVAPSASAEPGTVPSTEPSQAPSGEKTGPVTAQEQAQAALDINAGLKVIHNGTSASVQWSKVDGAKYYKVYAAYCGSKYKMIKTVDAAAKCKVTIKKLNGKKLSTTKNIKVYVAAYRTVETKNGETVTKKDVRIAKTIAGHVVGKKNKKYSNAKKIKLSKTSYTLKKGKKAKIKAKTVLQYPKRKQLGDAHAKEFRYASSDKSIATVSKSGKITAKKKGSCVIYVYARNGLAKKVKVTVK